MKKRLALITWSGLPQGAESERLMLPHLAAAGIETQILDWRTMDGKSPEFVPSQFDLIILRTCWDYHLRGTEFTEWLQRTAAVAPVLNDLETVLWNRSKFYLQEMQGQGIRIAPTVFVSATRAVPPEDWRQVLNWQKIVVKPAVSATAHKTWLFESATLPNEDELKNKMQGEPFLVQQFVPEIETQGEISFVYLDGAYSHAILKRPAAGDFRVQKDFGGSAEPFAPSLELLEQANGIAAAVRYVGDSLYCRIDVVEKDGKLILMEVELIEPELFLGLAGGAAERFAKAIVRRVK